MAEDSEIGALQAEVARLKSDLAWVNFKIAGLETDLRRKIADLEHRQGG